jgi:hypothetical protein
MLLSPAARLDRQPRGAAMLDDPGPLRLAEGRLTTVAGRAMSLFVGCSPR